MQNAAALDVIRRTLSPRFAPPPTPARAVLIHGAVTVLWLLLFLRAFGAGGLLAWSVGLAYVAYDTVLLAFVFVQTLPLARRVVPSSASGAPPSLGVIIAAHNECASLPATIAALSAQASPPDEICIADDGSTDGTAALLQNWAGPPIRWLRLAHGGKARALNAALAQMTQELVLTVDADTLLEPGAVLAMQRAFGADPALVAATGVLLPVCGGSAAGRVFQWFQTYEYMRNFLSRYAWGRQDGLLLISGAFAAYRRQAVLDVGGFDPDCLVEDYELTHRLRDVGTRRALGWRTAVVGGALARTEAPGGVAAFLRQRRRWFGGFLQTQLWYRHMIGNPSYGRLGTRMLPVKALDTMQPVFGLTSIALLLASWAGGGAVAPVAGVIGAKTLLDLGFYLWSLRLYRRWLGPQAHLRWGPAVLAALIEPFSFQVLRHLGATLGWVSFLTGRRQWGSQVRVLGNESRA